jgi:hypothetical protein
MAEINGRDPRRYGLDFGLWTRSLVAELIERKYAIRLGVTAVGELLAKLELTPQKPLQTTLLTKDIEAVTERLRKAGAQFITPDVVAIPHEAHARLGFKKAVIVRDPNGQRYVWSRNSQ